MDDEEALAEEIEAEAVAEARVEDEPQAVAVDGVVAELDPAAEAVAQRTRSNAGDQQDAG